MKGILSVLIVAVTTTSTAFGGDPVQWKPEDGGNGHWYEITDYGSFSDWTEAQAEALARGGHLATITSQAENDFVTNLYSSIGSTGSCDSCSSGSAALLGGRLNSDEEWTWVTGENWEYEDWYPGEPSGGSESVLYLRCPGQWNDGSDTLDTPCRYVAIIEYTRPIQWKLQFGGNGHWYEAVSVPEGLTWLQAKAEAEARGGYLATLTSEAEDQFVAFTIADSDTVWNFDGGVARGPYFGGQRTEDETGGCDLNTMQWVTGEPWGYTRWHSGNPNEDCTSGLQFWGYGQRSWQDNHDDDPSLANGYIVEYTILPGTPLGGCCLGGFHCLTSNESDCLACNGVWLGPDSSCELNGSLYCPGQIPCAADVDNSGSVGIDDLLIVIESWGSTCP